jgi:hypothetical protein
MCACVCPRAMQLLVCFRGEVSNSACAALSGRSKSAEKLFCQEEAKVLRSYFESVCFVRLRCTHARRVLQRARGIYFLRTHAETCAYLIAITRRQLSVMVCYVVSYPCSYTLLCSCTCNEYCQNQQHNVHCLLRHGVVSAGDTMLIKKQNN